MWRVPLQFAHFPYLSHLTCEPEDRVSKWKRNLPTAGLGWTSGGTALVEQPPLRSLCCSFSKSCSSAQAPPHTARQISSSPLFLFPRPIKSSCQVCSQASKQFLALCVLNVAVLSGVNGSTEVAEIFYYGGANASTSAGVDANAGLNIGSILKGYVSPVVQTSASIGAKVNVGTQVAGTATSTTPCAKPRTGTNAGISDKVDVSKSVGGKVSVDVSKSGGVGANTGISAGGLANSVSDETTSNTGGVKQTAYGRRSLRFV